MVIAEPQDLEQRLHSWQVCDRKADYDENCDRVWDYHMERSGSWLLM